MAKLVREWFLFKSYTNYYYYYDFTIAVIGSKTLLICGFVHAIFLRHIKLHIKNCKIATELLILSLDG